MPDKEDEGRSSEKPLYRVNRNFHNGINLRVGEVVHGFEQASPRAQLASTVRASIIHVIITLV